MAGRLVKRQRGPYKKRVLPRSATRVLAYLRVITGKSKTGWSTVNLGQISTYLQLSRSTVQRSKNLLESKKLLFFRTISNVSGRQGHFLLVGNPEIVLEEVHSKDVVGKVRRRWVRVGRELLKDGIVSPSSQIGGFSAGNRMLALVTRSSRAGGADRSVYSQKQVVTGGQNQVSNFIPQDKGISIIQKNTHLGAVSKVRPSPARWISTGQVRLAHRLKRLLLGKFWDNSKVLAPMNPGQIYNFCLRWITKGVDVNQIEKAFETALHKLHGTATDIGLLMGDPSLKFNVSSTVVKADKLLTKLFWDGKLTFYRN